MMMTFALFRDVFGLAGCVSRAEILARFPQFDKNNFTRWCGKGYLVKLRNGYYAFPEYMQLADFKYVVANKIYANSYVSLHSALIFHHYISEQLNAQISSVTSLKTYDCRNFFGKFNYRTLRSDLLFGFEVHSAGPFTFRIASPEKALTDLFYLFPAYYDSELSIRNFAIEVERLFENFNVERLYECVQKFDNQALERRISIFLRMYGLEAL